MTVAKPAATPVINPVLLIVKIAVLEEAQAPEMAGALDAESWDELCAQISWAPVITGNS